MAGPHAQDRPSRARDNRPPTDQRRDAGVTLDFATVPAASITPQHYALLVSEEEFDAAYAQITRRGIKHYADPHQKQPGAIDHNDGGRGVYFMDPAGHLMELVTVPYGGWTS
ncbi:hypothetical protein [Streptomyces sp. NPDC001809]